MTQRRSRLPAGLPAQLLRAAHLMGKLGRASMRARVPSLLLRPTPRHRALGLVVAALLIAAESFLVYAAQIGRPRKHLRCDPLLGVLVVATCGDSGSGR